MGYRTLTGQSRPQGIPTVSDTHYFMDPRARDGMAGLGVILPGIAALESLFPTDEEAEVGALLSDTTDDFKDGLTPKTGGTTTPATGGGTKVGTTTTFPAGGGAPVVTPNVVEGGGLSTGALVGVGVAALAVIGGLVYAKKKGKFR